MRYTEFAGIPEQLADNWNGEISTFSYHKNSSDILYKEDEIIAEELKKGRVVVANKIGGIESVKVFVSNKGLVVLKVVHPFVKYIDAFAEEKGENIKLDITTIYACDPFIQCSIFLPVKNHVDIRAAVWYEGCQSKIVLLERSDLEE